VSYEWDFGDGQTQTTTTPTVDHSYSTEGTKIVTLTVTDSSGDSAQIEQAINVQTSSGTTGGSTVRCVVPNLHGDKLAKARQALADHHCALGSVTRRRASKRVRGRVIGQSAKPGKVLSDGSAIGVTLGRRNAKAA
jgi:PKD repeat protein